MASFAAVLLWHVIALLVVANLGYASNLDAQKLNAEVIYARNGAVATDDRRCSRIGKDILREGGHAADAAVAAALCLGVVSPASSGLGGGAFMLLRQANGVSKAIDMRETAPSLASKDMYGGNTTLKAKGGLSVAVPGELAGLHVAWKQYGKLPWKRLVNPAEKLARGFKISAYIIGGTSEVLLNHFGKGLDPFSSVTAPRVYHQLIPNVVNYENWTTVSGDHFELSADIRNVLRSKGHVLQGLAGGTICQFIVIDDFVSSRKTKVNGNERLVAVSDPRKGGLPAGF